MISFESVAQLTRALQAAGEERTRNKGYCGEWAAELAEILYGRYGDGTEDKSLYRELAERPPDVRPEDVLPPQFTENPIAAHKRRMASVDAAARRIEGRW